MGMEADFMEDLLFNAVGILRLSEQIEAWEEERDALSAYGESDVLSKMNVAIAKHGTYKAERLLKCQLLCQNAKGIAQSNIRDNENAAREKLWECYKRYSELRDRLDGHLTVDENGEQITCWEAFLCSRPDNEIWEL